MKVVVLITILCFSTVFVSGSTKIGFNYWPYKGSSVILWDANWPSAKYEVEKDLVIMKGLGVEVVRLMFWSWPSGLRFNVTDKGFLSPEYYQILKNLPEFIELFEKYNIAVVIAFANTDYWAYRLDPPPGWTNIYEDSEAGFNEFARLSAEWINGLANSIENSPFKDAVICYDYQNEIESVAPRTEQYIRTLYDYTDFNVNKRGISLLWPLTDSDFLKTTLDQRQLKYIDFHYYPESNVNVNLEAVYDHLSSVFPNTKVFIGEFGEFCNAESKEQKQVEVALDLIERAKAHQIPYVMHWNLWDLTPDEHMDQLWGIGYSPNDPKDLYGALSALNSVVSNADMELVDGEMPLYYSCDGTIVVTMASHHSETDCATGSKYTRLESGGTNSGSFSLEADEIVVENLSSNANKLYVNAFIRSNMKYISISVDEYDSDRIKLTHSESDQYSSINSAWNNFMYHTSPWGVTLNDNTRFIRISFNAQTADAIVDIHYMDIDAVSAYIDTEGEDPQTDITTSVSDRGIIDNYPNPFDDQTIISIAQDELNEVGKRQIVICNSEGMVVFEEDIGKTDRIVINASGYNSGVYYYSLVVNGKIIQTKKMIILK